MAFGCRETERFVDAYLDGEFGSEDRTALEEHLGVCASCAEEVRFQAGFRTVLRKAAPRPLTPVGLRSRIGDALAKQPPPQPLWHRVAWLSAPAAAAAALLVLTLRAPQAAPPMVEDAIARHRRDLPIEVAGGADQVKAWFANKVDFAVRPPRLPKNSKLRGARLANIANREAAYLLYDIDGEKVSVLVFDPNAVPMEARHHRQVGNHEVYLDGQRGYNVALYRDRDIGYAFTAGMDEDRMFQLVSAAVEP